MSFVIDSRHTGYRQYNADSDMLRDNANFLGVGVNMKFPTTKSHAKVVTQGSNLRYLMGSLEATAIVAIDEVIAVLPTPYDSHEVVRAFCFVDTASVLTAHPVEIEGNEVRTLAGLASGAVLTLDNILFASK